ncbi:MAG: SDR family NAD(P)-dependent oxidoreductase [Bacteroidales bacterium]|nr:SDR family NAD(P)-dependent oxidoreductase [Bacteroidales bacterium]
MSKGTALVTGADGGMGTIHTRTLAKAGYDVIMACYDAEIARPTYDAIREETGATLFLKQVDLGNLQDIIRFADEVKKEFSSLQILLNNAGVLCHHAKNSVNGIEYTTAVNYLGHYTLTHALLPIMGQGTRIVSMVSIAYVMGKIRADYFEPTNDRKFNRFTTYGNSKRALYYFTLDAAEAWKERGICINVADPDIVSTGIIRQGNIVVDKLCDWIFRPLINTPEEGAATMLAAALNPEFEGVTGAYFKKSTVKKPKKKFYNNVQERTLLREMTQEVLRKNGIEL